MKLVWTRPAWADRRAIREYLAERNLAAALEMDAMISLRTGSLPDHPALGRPGRVAATRELVLHPNYIVIYDVMADSIRILPVLHAARQWPPAQ